MANHFFNEKRAVQAAAIFAKKAGNKIDKYKLYKMMYFLERQSLITTGQPLFFDSLFSAPFGPIASAINHGIDTVVPPKKEKLNREINHPYWKKHFKQIDHNMLSLIKDPGEDELSKSAIALIEQIHEKFKAFKWRDMQDFFHNLPEHKETKSRIPISYSDILRAEKFSEIEIESIVSEIDYYHQLTTA